MRSHGNVMELASSKKYVVLSVLLLVMLNILGLACAEEYLAPDEPRGSTETSAGLRSRIDEWREAAHRHLVSIGGTHALESTVENSKLYLGSLFGEERVESVAECLQGAVHFLSVGVASGLNVILVYVAEILRLTGIDVLPLPHCTPEGVASVTQWALLAIIGYWVLYLILRLTVSILRRVFWLLKLSAALVLFTVIVSDTKASTDTTALRLAGLVLACALLSLATSLGGLEKTSCLGARLCDLEGRLKVLERRKKE